MQAVSKIEQMPSYYTQDQIHLLKNTICRGISDNDFMIFSHICKRTGLDPFARQIYAVARKGQMTIQTGIDGYRLIAERTGKYAPGREPTYAYDSNGKLLSATSYIKKQTADGTWHEVCATAFFAEYVQVYNGQPSQFWAKMPHGQIAKCAEALALRKAFPQEMSGIYTAEEMQQADVEIQAESVEDNKPKVISEEQFNEISNVMSQCPADYKKKIDDFLKKGKITLRSFPLDLYPKFLTAAIKSWKDHQASQEEQEVDS